ncbi:MAG: (d)CMP kinase [bacterium]
MTADRNNHTFPTGMIIAIDGPAGSGKSTTALLVARRLGYRYLDTGAMYRALTYYALSNGIDPTDERRLAAAVSELKLDFDNRQGNNHVLIDGVDISRQIRTPEVTAHVSEVSAHRLVRRAMVARQQQLGKDGSLVTEGRDTTTVVFPGAQVKIFLQASISERARRRLSDLTELGIESTLEQQVAEIRRRDGFDSNRAHSPLTRAEDAHLLDTTDLTIEQQVDKIVSLAQAAAGDR